ELWHQFCPKAFDLKPCFIPRAFGEKLTNWQFEKIRNDLRSRVENEITVFRTARNLSTKYNKDENLELFLQRGLELLHQLNTARDEDTRLAQMKLLDWKDALMWKIPKGYRLRAVPLQSNSADTKYVADLVVSKVDFLECRDRAVSFTTSVLLFNLPGELLSVYVYVMICQKITQRERRRLLAAKEK
ncbi:hypothetical protein IE077_003545, partial [Cardiosporidium cionae]